MNITISVLLQSRFCGLNRVIINRNVLLVNSSADHLKVGDFGLSKLIRVQNSHDVYKMTGETGSCEYLCNNYIFVDLFLRNSCI